MTSSIHPFTIEHYKEILSAILASDYRVSLFSEADLPEKVIYIRHDIDNDIGVAHHMASVESEMGMQSTYLVLLRSGNYNPAERENYIFLRQMMDMGHEIGLHFSMIDHPALGHDEDVTKLVRQDADLLSSIIDAPINIFGFHNPGEADDPQVSVEGLINTYDRQYFDHAFYASESNMAWKKGCPCQFPDGITENVVQILIHPLTYAAHHTSDFDVLVHFIRLKLEYLIEYNAQANATLRHEEDLFNRLLSEFVKSSKSA